MKKLWSHIWVYLFEGVNVFNCTLDDIERLVSSEQVLRTLDVPLTRGLSSRMRNADHSRQGLRSHFSHHRAMEAVGESGPIA